PGVTFVLAHGGRGHWYADAAALALAGPDVWIDLAGLPPKRLPGYYAGFDLPALARRWIFGTDWPGVPAWPGTRARSRPSACPATSWPACSAATPPRSTCAANRAGWAPRRRSR